MDCLSSLILSSSQEKLLLILFSYLLIKEFFLLTSIYPRRTVINARIARIKLDLD